MGRAYNPMKVIKASGVHTVYIGKPQDPVTKAFEAYCFLNGQTFSESIRDMVTYYLVKQDLIEDPGVDKNVFLNAGEGKLTKKYSSYRKQAERCRDEQIEAMNRETE